MRLRVFDVIDETLSTLQENQTFYEACLQNVRSILRNVLSDENEMVIDIRGRIKSKESLQRKNNSKSFLYGI